MAFLDKAERRLETWGMHKVYFVFMIAFGIVLTFVTPIYHVPDEMNHIARAYQISEGGFFSLVDEKTKTFVADAPTAFSFSEYFKNKDTTGKFLPTDVKAALDTPFDTKSRVFFPIPNTGDYAPLIYMPQALGAVISRNLGMSAGSIFYSMRLFAVVFVAFSVALAIKILPQKRMLIFLLAAMPMFAFQCAAISSDAFLFGSTVLISAYPFSLTLGNTRLGVSDIVLLLLVTIVLALSKQVYGVILLIYLLIPTRRMGSKKYFFGFFVFLVAVYMLTVGLWYVGSAQGYEIAHQTNPDGSSDVAAQLNFVLSEPMTYLGVLLETFKRCGKDHLESFVGVLGWLNVFLPKNFWAIYLFLLFISAIFGKLSLTLAKRMVLIFGTILSVTVIYLYEYLFWTPVHNDIVIAIQGRYFIPLGVMFFCSMSLFNKLRYENILTCILAITSLSFTVYHLILFYY